MTEKATEANLSTRLDEFQSYRTRMNARIAEIDQLGLKRFFNLDTMAYKDGALPPKVKELLGLVASMVLRCNDCIDYHILQCVEVGWKDEELYEAFNVALVVAGASSYRTCATLSKPSTWRAQNNAKTNRPVNIRFTPVDI